MPDLIALMPEPVARRRGGGCGLRRWRWRGRNCDRGRPRVAAPTSGSRRSTCCAPSRSCRRSARRAARRRGFRAPGAVCPAPSWRCARRRQRARTQGEEVVAVGIEPGDVMEAFGRRSRSRGTHRALPFAGSLAVAAAHRPVGPVALAGPRIGGNAAVGDTAPLANATSSMSEEFSQGICCSCVFCCTSARTRRITA